MDKNAIKKYAVWARRELISRVSQKALQYGITEEDSLPAEAADVNGVVLSREEMQQRKALIERIGEKGYEQVMEEVAYTWFNRFIALRFMEVNGYLPSHVRVFTDEDNSFRPQILAEAIHLEMDGLDMERVYALKDANDDEALFKYLIIVQCNALNPILPRMFQRISDYTELLFPDNLLREGSVVQQMIELIPEEDWRDAVQIIGWLYEAYNTERNEIVYDGNLSRTRIPKELLPAATTIFTPDWPVRYMVENSLGRLWVEGHPSDKLKAGWKYYLEEAEQEPAVQEQLAAIRREYAAITPEQIKCIDPCSGSGHILAYMFDVLVQIYAVYGHSVRNAVRSIVEKNLYGLDIDERAAQLAYFSVMMKARQYDSRFLARRDENGNPDVPQPHVYAIAESNGMDLYAVDYFVNGDPKRKAAMDSILREMRDAKEYGSILSVTPVDFEALYERFEEVRDDVDLSRETVLKDLLPLVQVAEALAQKYEVVVTNPPYLGSSRFSSALDKYVKDYYADVKYDLSMVMYKKAFTGLTKKTGYTAFITTSSWMFLSSFEKLRKLINATSSIVSLVDFGTELFDGKVGHNPIVAWVSCNCKIKYRMTAVRLVDYCYSRRDEKELEFFNPKNRYTAQQDSFAKIPGAPVAYWVSERFLNLFDKETIIKVCTQKTRISTGDNNRFMRLWYEIDSTKMFYPNKWLPCPKGGDFRKWYGNVDLVINWENDGEELRSFDRAMLGDRTYFMKPGITWTVISSKKTSFRTVDAGAICDHKGPLIYFTDKKYTKYVLALLNSIFSQKLLEITAPTIGFEWGAIAKTPLLVDESNIHKVDDLVSQATDESKSDWDSFETSWDFLAHPLVLAAEVPDLNGGHKATLADSYAKWEALCEKRFNQLKANEEELNRIFIDIYGLQDELTPEVADQDVTVRKADLKRDVKSLISYAVGCMFGRYSLDVPGLAYAGGEWDDSQYTAFRPDADNILPICDDEYFAEDIVGRFVRFIEVVYGADALQENLRFIADALGGSGQPKDVIRSYFLNDFYADHLKIYQKRPIYWLFDSGKKGGFRALVYMHRYQPDTIARMRTDYVHEQQARYRTAIADVEQRIVSASTAERVKLNKQLKKLQEQAAEIQVYEEKIHHLADRYISIDLDDGVKKNYALFGDVLAKIK